MVGIGTSDVNLDKYRHTFCSLLGKDEDSWGLSYTGNTDRVGSSSTRGATRPVNPFMKDTRAAAGSLQPLEHLSWPTFCRAHRPGVGPCQGTRVLCHITTLGFQCCSLCSGVVKPQLSPFHQPLWDGRAGVRNTGMFLAVSEAVPAAWESG